MIRTISHRLDPLAPHQSACHPKSKLRHYRSTQASPRSTGWDVRLVDSYLEVVQTQVCRDQEEVLTTGERWKAALAEKGWR